MIAPVSTLKPLLGAKKPKKQIVGFKTTIVAVHDGDTVSCVHSDKVSDTVRLIGIDAPEISQPAGDVAQKALSDLILNKQVRIETKYRDAHGRLLGRILLNGTDINLQMLTTGMAWLFYLANVAEDLRGSYQKAFADAQANKTGIFAGEGFIEPSEWRKVHLVGANQ